LKNLPPELNHLQVNYLSGYASIRYDTRNSFINPSRGIVLQGESELAPEMEANDVNFSRLSAWFQYYSRIFYPNTVFAFRLGVQSLSGENLPVQVLLPIGGNNTLRGFPQDRFLDNASVMINSELRFPIYSRLGGIIGWDTGRVFGKVNQFSFSNWHHNPLIGLRYYFDTFIVRLDVGFGKDTLGFYLNFGHIF